MLHNMLNFYIKCLLLVYSFISIFVAKYYYYNQITYTHVFIDVSVGMYIHWTLQARNVHEMHLDMCPAVCYSSSFSLHPSASCYFQTFT